MTVSELRSVLAACDDMWPIYFVDVAKRRLSFHLVSLQMGVPIAVKDGQLDLTGILANGVGLYEESEDWIEDIPVVDLRQQGE